MQHSIRFLFAALLLGILVASLGAQTTKAPKPAVPTERALLRIYPVAGGEAEPLAKLLQEVFEAGKARISPLGRDKIAVWATPEVHLEIARQPPFAERVMQLIPLGELDGASVLGTLQAMFGEARTGGPFLELVHAGEALLVRGNAEQVSEIKAAIQLMARNTQTTASVRVLLLKQANASTFADVLAGLLPKLTPRANPVHIVLASEPNRRVPTETLPTPKKDDTKANPSKADTKPPKSAPPITLTAFGNRLIIATEDANAMALAVDLVRLLEMEMPAAQNDLEVIRLKNGNAVNVAKVLQEVFNGPKSQRVRIIADPASNSLLIKANALDLHTIRSLLARHLDTPHAASEKPSGSRTFIIPIKHADAEKVAELLVDVFGPGSAQSSPDKRAKVWEVTGRRVSFSIGVDLATNSLVVSGPADDMLSIRTLVTRGLDIPGAADKVDGSAKKKKQAKK